MQPREPGQLLGEKYRLIRLLGKGGMGSVWHAQHLVLNAPVALKFIESERLDPTAQQRFLGEARMAAALRSPHVVQILDYGVDDGTPHIAMELLDGESLAARLERAGRLSPRDTARVMQQVVRAIGRAHDAGIVHRDLKPENVFIVKNDDDELVKVLDFGIAKGDKSLLGETAAASTSTGQLLGTPYYMSPEQVDGSGIDHRTDIWALGVLTFECLIGELPFTGDSVGRLVLSICSRPLPVPSETAPVPPGFDGWFARACARSRDERFSNVREAGTALMVLCDAPDRGSADPGPAPGRRATEPAPAGSARADALAMTTGQATNSELLPRSRSQTRRRLSWIAAASVLGLAAIVALVWLQSTPDTSTAETKTAAQAALQGAPPPTAPRAETPPVVPEPQRSFGQPSPEPSPPAATPTPVQNSATGPAAALERRAKPVPPQRAPARPAATRVKPRPASTPSERGRVPEVPPENVDLGI